MNRPFEGQRNVEAEPKKEKQSVTGEKWRELLASVPILVAVKLHRLCTLVPQNMLI